jgi:Lar family restriction alleviation protein
MKPCPFCGETPNDVQVASDDGECSFVVCVECGAAGPIVEGDDLEAIAAWNKRVFTQ